MVGPGGGKCGECLRQRCDQNVGIAAVTVAQREETALAIVVLFVVGVGGSSSSD
jgi:hypothetical protein